MVLFLESIQRFKLICIVHKQNEPNTWYSITDLEGIVGWVSSDYCLYQWLDD